MNASAAPGAPNGNHPVAPHGALSARHVLLAGAIILMLSVGIRHGFGLWLQPVTMERGWNRETFALALAIQNIAWGLAGPFAGMAADRWGALRVLIAGTLLYALGLVGMAFASTPLAFHLSTGIAIGVAQAGTTYTIVYGVIARNLAPEQRSWAMGVTAATGSFGQFLMVPVESWLIAQFGWQASLWLLGAAVLAIIPAALLLREPMHLLQHGAGASTQTIGEAIREAFRYRSFQLLTAGYFVCGFQVVFIGVHLPSYLKDHGLPPHVATTALALIGLFNVFGTYIAGTLGQRLPKRYILSANYLLRAVAIAVFIHVPLSAASVYGFAIALGFLWLSTVPPTNALVAQIFGVRHMTMLAGFVFLNHQIGSFLGAWLGGRLYDATGSYDVVWWICIALGVLAALINLPVREHAIHRAPVKVVTA